MIVCVCTSPGSEHYKDRVFFPSGGGVDYDDVVQDITFTSTTVGPIKINIPINDDLLCEGNEIIGIGLGSVSPDVTLSPQSGTVTIEDDGKTIILFLKGLK